MKTGVQAVLVWAVIGFFAVGGVAVAQAPDLSRMDIVLKSIPDGPVARVGNEIIGPDEFRDLYVSELTRFQFMGGKRNATDVDRITLAMKCLRLLVERSILIQEAARRKLTVSDKELDDAWNEEMGRLGKALSTQTGGSMDEAEILKVAGATRDEARQELRRTLLIEKMRQQIIKEKNVAVNDAEVTAFFEENKGNARTGDHVHIQQIFIRAAEGGQRRSNTPTREQALARAQTALKRIKSGESFAGVARSECDGPLKEKGGDVGMLALDSLPEPLQAAIAKMRPGELSDVIESEHGFHIVKLIELAPGKEITIEDAAPQIRAVLMARKGNEAIRQFCAEVSEGRFNIQVYLDLDKQISVRPDLMDLFKERDEGNAQPSTGAAS